ncbi:stage III sporulation protein AB [Flavonifractor plautii]|nr:stage III sporulation protein AB [Flavonifractor plautii]
MLKLIGALLLVRGGGAGLLRRRPALPPGGGASGSAGGTGGMEREIAFRLTPMPELLERAAAESPPPVCTLFARCRTLLDELGERSMAELWREALEQVPLGLDGPGRLALEELGRCWAAMTGTGSGKPSPTPVRSCPGRWSRPGRPGKQGRMYQVLGITAGAFLVILLL